MKTSQRRRERTWVISDDMKNNKIVRASELGQYEFCSMYHYLIKNGEKLDGEGSKLLEQGTVKHSKHGKNIDHLIAANRGISYLIAIMVGVILLIILYLFL